MDDAGLITVFNEGAERMLGYSADEMVGRATPELLHDPQEIVARARELAAFSLRYCLAPEHRSDRMS